MSSEWPKMIAEYLFPTSTDCRELGEEIGLTGEALKRFSVNLATTEVVMEVNEDGSYRILSFPGKSSRRGIE